MFKKYLRWILPLIVILMIALAILLTPIVATHAAGDTSPTPTVTTSGPDVFYHY